MFNPEWIDDEKSEVYLHLLTGFLAVRTYGRIVRGKYAPASIELFERHPDIKGYDQFEDAPGHWKLLGDL